MPNPHDVIASSGTPDDLRACLEAGGNADELDDDHFSAVEAACLKLRRLADKDSREARDLAEIARILVVEYGALVYTCTPEERDRQAAEGSILQARQRTELVLAGLGLAGRTPRLFDVSFLS